jgi:hypothetical protein
MTAEEIEALLRGENDVRDGVVFRMGRSAVGCSSLHAAARGLMTSDRHFASAEPPMLA